MEAKARAARDSGSRPTGIEGVGEDVRPPGKSTVRVPHDGPQAQKGLLQLALGLPDPLLLLLDLQLRRENVHPAGPCQLEHPVGGLQVQLPALQEGLFHRQEGRLVLGIPIGPDHIGPQAPGLGQSRPPPWPGPGPAGWPFP